MWDHQARKFRTFAAGNIRVGAVCNETFCFTSRKGGVERILSICLVRLAGMRDWYLGWEICFIQLITDRAIAQPCSLSDVATCNVSNCNWFWSGYMRLCTACAVRVG